MTKFVNGPAHGLDIRDRRSQVWVAMLDGRARVLPDKVGPDLEDLLNRVGRGNWELYERVDDADPVAYLWVTRTP